MFKKKVISFALVALCCLSIFSACNINSENTSKYVLNNSIKNENSSMIKMAYNTFDGRIVKKFKIKESKVLNITINSEEGNLDYVIVDSADTELKRAESVVSGNYTFTLEKADTYYVRVYGTGSKGGFEISIIGDSQ